MSAVEQGRRAAAFIGRAIRGFFAALFGSVQWRPPMWVGKFGAVIRAFALRCRAQPRRFLGGLLASVLVIGAAAFGWHWYSHRPKPVETTFTADSPARTCIECEAPGNQPKPLIVHFSASVAPLKSAGKAIDPKTSGIEISPAVAGVWSFSDDKTLQLQPAADWPVGQKYAVTFAKRGFAAEQIRLKAYSFDFSSAPFTATVANTEFYQDPVNAADKKVIVTAGFSHPVDTADFESRIKLQLYERLSDTKEEQQDAPKFSVTYDKLRLNAYIHSAQISVNAKAGRLTSSIDAGLRAARGGNQTAEPLNASVDIPGIFSLRVSDIKLDLARDEQDNPSQILILNTSFSVLEPDIVSHVHAYLLPLQNSDTDQQAQWAKHHKDKPYPWAAQYVSPAVLKASEALPLSYSPNEREHVELHSFRYQADPGRYAYVVVDKGLKSFGGYQLAEPVYQLLEVPAYPQQLSIMHTGALLAMSGAKKLTVFSRDVPGMRVQIGRLLPDQLQHLVTQTNGNFSSPSFNNSYEFDENNITEHFIKIVRLPKLAPGTPHYESIDLGEYLNKDAADRRGIFFVKVDAYDPDKQHVIAAAQASSDADADSSDSGSNWGRVVDTRLIVVTDLGLLVKKSVDGSQDVFVQSIHSGEPVAGVTVDVLGKNGEPVLTQTSDATGHVHFTSLKSFKRERQPVLYLAKKNGDSAFLPIGRADRMLDLSRFDIGGVANAADSGRLSAYLFSDRGIYRPGDEIRIGAIVKAQDWTRPLVGVPLRVQVSDPRGTVVKRESIQLSAAGFEDIRYLTRDNAPTGDYTISLAIIKDEDREDPIGSMTVKVQEFLPDRLRMNAHLSSESADGWVSPDDLKLNVSLQNLFGTSAENRRVTGQMTLSPAFPNFTAWRDWQFRDPQTAKEGFSDPLPDAKSDASGAASFDLNLKRFARATYRLSVLSEGFEADGGRGVSAQVSQLVSSLPYLLGWKADGDLSFVSRGAARKLSFIAIDAKAKKTTAKDLKLVRIERRTVSVLTQTDSGAYKYLSKQKDIVLDEKPFDIAAAGAAIDMDTTTPGSFLYRIEDASGQVFAAAEYTVAGAANLAARMDRNAELQIKLDKTDYAPGDDIQLQIQAPYTGAGLITIERDHVYSWRWFKADTSSSVQTIKLPDGIEGNAYVSVSFVRDPGSPEIYASPLSYGVQPFSIALDARKTAVTLTAPTLIKPGQRLAMHYKTDRPARIVVFAIDEGILQVARYKTPNALGYFFEKRSLDVGTAQILDMILPEFEPLMNAAPGGDADGALSRHLNPFKRKTDKPVAFWSGILDADSTEREVDYEVPDYFNGELRLMAVAVAPDAVGITQASTTVRGDFVLSPNAPTAAVPGDEFDVSVGVANNVAGSGADAPIIVSVARSSQLEIEGPVQQTVKVGEMHESVAHFKVKALDDPGSATLKFHAALGDKSAGLSTTLSVRPATPYRTQLTTGSFTNGVTGGSHDVPMTRDLYPQFRNVEAGISVLPLTLAHGLSSYLGNYPYDCTEQLVSQAMPAIVLGNRPEFGYVKKLKGADLAGLIDELRQRQNGEGGYRLWPGGGEVVEFVSLYAQQVLLEAQERGQAVPQDLIKHGNDYLRQIAARDGESLQDERDSAYAIYLLTRQGIVMANESAALQARLEERYGPKAGDWKTDITAAYLASAYQLMKQQRLADSTIAKVAFGREDDYDGYHSGLTTDSELLYLLARHFPDRAKNLPADFLPGLADRIGGGEYDSLSAANTILALDQYATTIVALAAGKLSIAEIDRSGASKALALPDSVLPKVAVSPQAAKLKFGNDSDARAFYLIDESGFDHQPPVQALAQGFEIIREYTDAAGKPADHVKLGQELTVHVKFRATDNKPIYGGVLVDMLPGGFEVAIPPVDPAAQAHESASPDAAAADSGDDAESDSGDDSIGDCGCSFFYSHPPKFPDFADLREDRVVAYGTITSDVQELTYHIKATNTGSFTVPPAYGEAMYQRNIQARSVAARIIVETP